jgi:hypothetical protein
MRIIPIFATYFYNNNNEEVFFLESRVLSAINPFDDIVYGATSWRQKSWRSPSGGTSSLWR